MSVLRLLLLPLAWLYGLVLVFRHALYDAGVFKSTRPELPVIVIGNLALGGTGKTPMLELVLRTLQPLVPLATLSRGYGRRGTELREVQADDVADEVGDEPLQVKRKFPLVHVNVGADRVKSIAAIRSRIDGLRAVVLDDGFQHRALDGSLNILLTTHHRPWYKDHLFPAGDLRDLASRRRDAQLVVVTKCPALPNPADQAIWREKLGLRPDQELFFSGIEYDELSVVGSQLSGPAGQLTTGNYLLFTGIADPQPVVEHLRSKGTVDHVAFPDHHRFSPNDLEKLAERYATFAAGRKMLVTTEKDAMRLDAILGGSALAGLPITVIRMKAVILNEPERFATLIKDHVGSYQAHS